MSDVKIKKKRKQRLDALTSLCKTLNNGKFGGTNKDAVTFFGGGEESRSIERFPSGAKTLDYALGGGWPRGRICEIYGPESGGKSTLCLHAIAEHQKMFPDYDVAIIDSEHSFDVDYARNLNVDVDLLLIHQPESGEQALNIVDQLIDHGVKLMVVDSVAALTTQAELDGDIGDPKVATQARLMSGGLRRLVAKVNRTKSVILFTNQVRDLIGVTWGAKTTTPGGRALKFYSSCRVEVRRMGSDKEGEEIVSNRVQAKVVKNKTAPPFRKADFVITFGYGIDQIAAVLDDALLKKVVKKSGAWFKIDGETVAQGRLSLLDMMRKDSELLKRIEDGVEAIEASVVDETSDSDEKEEKTTKKNPSTRKMPVLEEESKDSGGSIEDNSDDAVKVETV